MGEKVSHLGLTEKDLYEWARRGGLTDEESRFVATVGMMPAGSDDAKSRRFNNLFYKAGYGR